MKPVSSDPRLGRLGQLSAESLEAFTKSVPTESSTASRLAMDAVDMALLINEEEKFLQAAMVLCNELKARYKTAQVS